jgi:hypothetical protein
VTQVTDAARGRGQTGGVGHPAASAQEHAMKSNVGGIDRILRIVLGLALLALTLTGTIGVWGWIGLVLLATAAFGFCPLYTVLGMNTCAMKKS